MARELKYRQCRLSRMEEGVTISRVTWIPEEHKGTKLEIGSTVTLRDHMSGEDLPGRWRVETMSEDTVTERIAKERAHKWRGYRAATDV